MVRAIQWLVTVVVVFSSAVSWASRMTAAPDPAHCSTWTVDRGHVIHGDDIGSFALPTNGNPVTNAHICLTTCCQRSGCEAWTTGPSDAIGPGGPCMPGAPCCYLKNLAATKAQRFVLNDSLAACGIAPNLPPPPPPPPPPSTGCLDLIKDCGAKGDGTTDDTAAFATCQLKVATMPGDARCITASATTFRCINVSLTTSFVRWEFAGGATFLPALAMRRPENVFNVGGVDMAGVPILVRNISIMGPSPDHKFVIDISKPQLSPWNVRGVTFTGHVVGFTLANVLVKLANPAIDPTITIEGEKSAIETGTAGGMSPTDGSFINITSTGGIWGYGTTQIQTGQRLLFENLDGSGGTTLRLETGAGEYGAFVDQIVAKNIVCRNGHASVMIAPHCQMNGLVTVSNVTAIGCNSGVDIGAGYADPARHPNCTVPGVYDNRTTVRGVTGVFGLGQAKNMQTPDIPACAPCSLGSPKHLLNFKVEVSGIVSEGYPSPSSRTTCVSWEKFWTPPCYYNGSSGS